MPGGDKVGFRLVMIQHGNRVSLRRSKNTRKISLQFRYAHCHVCVDSFHFRPLFSIYLYFKLGAFY